MSRTQSGITVNACASRESARTWPHVPTVRDSRTTKSIAKQHRLRFNGGERRTAPTVLRKKKRRLRHDNYQWHKVINRAAFGRAHAMYNRNGSFLSALLIANSSWHSIFALCGIKYVMPLITSWDRSREDCLLAHRLKPALNNHRRRASAGDPVSVCTLP